MFMKHWYPLATKFKSDLDPLTLEMGIIYMYISDPSLSVFQLVFAEEGHRHNNRQVWSKMSSFLKKGGGALER